MAVWALLMVWHVKCHSRNKFNKSELDIGPETPSYDLDSNFTPKVFYAVFIHSLEM